MISSALFTRPLPGNLVQLALTSKNGKGAPAGNRRGTISSCRADPVAAAGQNSCPPAGRYLAVCGQSLATVVTGRPLRAGEFAAAAGLSTEKAKVEGLRSKLRLLAERGWLAPAPGGLFTLNDHAGKTGKHVERLASWRKLKVILQLLQVHPHLVAIRASNCDRLQFQLHGYPWPRRKPADIDVLASSWPPECGVGAEPMSDVLTRPVLKRLLGDRHIPRHDLEGSGTRVRARARKTLQRTSGRLRWRGLTAQ